MGKVIRKNLILDDGELTELMQRRGLSASALVRDLIRDELSHLKAADELAAAYERLDEEWAKDFGAHLADLYGPIGELREGEPAAGAAT